MDYLRFCQMLLNDGELEGKRIVRRKSVELMRANHLGDLPSGYSYPKLGHRMRFGLTFGAREAPIETGEIGSEGWYYWGGVAGTSFWIDPVEELVGVFMVNYVEHDEDVSARYGKLFELLTYQAIAD